MAVGRTSEPRTVTLTATTGSAAVTGAAGTFSRRDVGRVVTGTGIPAATTLAAVASDTAATLSANATTTGARSVVVGSATSAAADAAAYGFVGWSPEDVVEAERHTLAANNAGQLGPERLTNPTTGVASLHRSRG